MCNAFYGWEQITTDVKQLNSKEMKTTRTLFFFMIATLTASLAMASGRGTLNVNMDSEGEMTIVAVSSAQMSYFEIELRDEFGDKLYSMRTKAPTNSFTKKYDFSGLLDGTYWYSVKMNNETTEKKLEVENGKLEVSDIRRKIDPVFVWSDENLKVSFLNPHLENTKLLVYDSKNYLLAEAEIGSEFAMHKAVDFSNKDSGYYEVVISNDIEIYKYTVSID